jgi:uncharacterized membrane protein YbhN (UPF0104 family)
MLLRSILTLTIILLTMVLVLIFLVNLLTFGRWENGNQYFGYITTLWITFILIRLVAAKTFQKIIIKFANEIQSNKTKIKTNLKMKQINLSIINEMARGNKQQKSFQFLCSL